LLIALFPISTGMRAIQPPVRCENLKQKADSHVVTPTKEARG
jgi:hypothetical protein